MKEVVFWAFLWLVLFPGLALAQQGIEETGPKCQNLAHEFADNPNTLNEMQLRELQFCVTQTIEQRNRTNPPELLKGTIIEPPLPSETPGMNTPAPSQQPVGQQ